MDKLDENLSESTPINESNDADTTFEPTIDELMDELIDDEQTLREEEEIAALEDDNPLDEISKLKEESEMPLEELLAKYNAMPPAGPPRKKLKKSAKNQTKTKTPKSVSKADEESTIKEVNSTEEQEVEENVIEEVVHEENETEHLNGKDIIDDETANETDIANLEQKTSEKLKIRRSHLFELYPEQNFDSTIAAAQHQGMQIETLFSEDEDMDDVEEEEETDLDYVKKTIMVGSAFQAVIPGLSQYGDILPYENEDKLVWGPSQVSESEVEDYLLKVREIKTTSTEEESPTALAEDKVTTSTNVTNIAAVSSTEDAADKQITDVTLTKQNLNENKSADGDSNGVVKDNEQALHLLVQCGYDFKEALRRKKLNSVPLTGGTMSIWSEEECQKFEEGIQKFGKDFLKIRKHQVRTRTMRELVQFYYLWKKSERRDHSFANADTVDHMDIYLNEGEDYGTSSGNTPAAASTLLMGRKMNGCSQNSSISIMSSPTKSSNQNRKRCDSNNSNLLNSGSTNLSQPK